MNHEDTKGTKDNLSVFFVLFVTSWLNSLSVLLF